MDASPLEKDITETRTRLRSHSLGENLWWYTTTVVGISAVTMTAGTVIAAAPDLQDAVSAAIEADASLVSTDMIDVYFDELRQGFDDMARGTGQLLDHVGSRLSEIRDQYRDGTLHTAHDETIRGLPMGDSLADAFAWAVGPVPEDASALDRYSRPVVGAGAALLAGGSLVGGAAKAVETGLNIAARAHATVRNALASARDRVFGRTEPAAVSDPFADEAPAMLSAKGADRDVVKTRMTRVLENMGARGDEAERFTNAVIDSFGAVNTRLEAAEKGVESRDTVIAELRESLSGIEERLAKVEDPKARQEHVAQTVHALLSHGRPDPDRMPEGHRTAPEPD